MSLITPPNSASQNSLEGIRPLTEWPLRLVAKACKYSQSPLKKEKHIDARLAMYKAQGMSNALILRNAELGQSGAMTKIGMRFYEAKQFAHARLYFIADILFYYIKSIKTKNMQQLISDFESYHKQYLKDLAQADLDMMKVLIVNLCMFSVDSFWQKGSNNLHGILQGMKLPQPAIDLVFDMLKYLLFVGGINASAQREHQIRYIYQENFHKSSSIHGQDFSFRQIDYHILKKIAMKENREGEATMLLVLLESGILSCPKRSESRDLLYYFLKFAKYVDNAASNQVLGKYYYQKGELAKAFSYLKKAEKQQIQDAEKNKVPRITTVIAECMAGIYRAGFEDMKPDFNKAFWYLAQVENWGDHAILLYELLDLTFEHGCKRLPDGSPNYEFLVECALKVNNSEGFKFICILYLDYDYQKNVLSKSEIASKVELLVRKLEKSDQFFVTGLLYAKGLKDGAAGRPNLEMAKRFLSKAKTYEAYYTVSLLYSDEQYQSNVTLHNFDEAIRFAMKAYNESSRPVCADYLAKLFYKRARRQKAPPMHDDFLKAREYVLLNNSETSRLLLAEMYALGYLDPSESGLPNYQKGIETLHPFRHSSIHIQNLLVTYYYFQDIGLNLQQNLNKGSWDRVIDFLIELDSTHEILHIAYFDDLSTKEQRGKIEKFLSQKINENDLKAIFSQMYIDLYGPFYLSGSIDFSTENFGKYKLALLELEHQYLKKLFDQPCYQFMYYSLCAVMFLYEKGDVISAFEYFDKTIKDQSHFLTICFEKYLFPRMFLNLLRGTVRQKNLFVSHEEYQKKITSLKEALGVSEEPSQSQEIESSSAEIQKEIKKEALLAPTQQALIPESEAKSSRNFEAPARLLSNKHQIKKLFQALPFLAQSSLGFEESQNPEKEERADTEVPYQIQYISHRLEKDMEYLLRQSKKLQDLFEKLQEDPLHPDIGHIEVLKHEYHGMKGVRSLRITKGSRLVYKILPNHMILVLSAEGHYDD